MTKFGFGLLVGLFSATAVFILRDLGCTKWAIVGAVVVLGILVAFLPDYGRR